MLKVAELLMGHVSEVQVSSSFGVMMMIIVIFVFVLHLHDYLHYHHPFRSFIPHDHHQNHHDHHRRVICSNGL